MRYIIRIFSYFVKISLAAAAVILVLSYLKVIPSDINEIFKDGVESIKIIGLMFFAVSCVYPLIGYIKRGVVVPGEYSQLRDSVVSLMEEKGYVLDKEEGEDMYFKNANPVKRVLSLGDDRIALLRKFPGFMVEGKSKHVIRIVSALEYRLRGNE